MCGSPFGASRALLKRETMIECTDRDDRRAKARAEYERIMTTREPRPDGGVHRDRA